MAIVSTPVMLNWI